MLDGRTLVRKGSIVLNNTSRSCVSLLEEGDNRLLHAGEEEDKRLLHAGQEQDKRLLHAGEEGDKLSIKYVQNTLLSSCTNGEQYQHVN